MSTTANYVTAYKGRVFVGPGCASSTTEVLRSKPPGEKRRQKRGRVHFDPSLNWSIEEEKSLSGSAARRERREQKKMARENARERKKTVLQILKDPNKYDQIKRLYNADQFGSLKFALQKIIGYREGDTDFQQKFQQLQDSDLTYETLSDDQYECLKMLSGNTLFVNEFRGEREKTALQILKDPNKYDQIKRLYNATNAELDQLWSLKIALHEIIGYREGDTDFQQKFQQLQDSDLTYEALSDKQYWCLKMLSGNTLFVNEFRGVLPAEPVTDGSSSDDSHTQKRHKRRKEWHKTTEVSDKRDALNNGGPPSSPAGPNEVVGNNLLD